MTKKELVNAMAAKTDCSGAADRAVNALVEVISDTLKRGIRERCPALERSKYVSAPRVRDVIRKQAKN